MVAFLLIGFILTIFSCWKVSVSLFLATMQVRFLIFGIDLWFSEVYYVKQLNLSHVHFLFADILKQYVGAGRPSTWSLVEYQFQWQALAI